MNTSLQTNVYSVHTIPKTKLKEWMLIAIFIFIYTLYEDLRKLEWKVIISLLFQYILLYGGVYIIKYRQVYIICRYNTRFSLQQQQNINASINLCTYIYMPETARLYSPRRKILSAFSLYVQLYKMKIFQPHFEEIFLLNILLLLCFVQSVYYCFVYKIHVRVKSIYISIYIYIILQV